METDDELNEHELEEKLYAMIHHVDHTQSNMNEHDDNQQNKNHTSLSAIQTVENAPRNTVWRYWRSTDSSAYKKVNTQEKPLEVVKIPPNTKATPTNIKAKKDQNLPQKSKSPVDLSILQSPVPQILQKTIQYLDNDIEAVVLESSDEDEVVEVVLPPKPTITIESSDDDDEQKEDSPIKADLKLKSDHIPNSVERDLAASPVASVVSSVSDEFIRSDCIALKISSRSPDNHSFDFSLHGSDLCVQGGQSKKKKRKKNKETVTSTPVAAPVEKPSNSPDGCFATPKSKAKNKKLEGKSISNKINITPDVYDSDSNQANDVNKIGNPYIVTRSSLPNVDVYESDSNQSEIQIDHNLDQSRNNASYDIVYSSDSSMCNDNTKEAPNNAKRSDSSVNSTLESVDLTQNCSFVTLDETGINESIVMANVTGFNDSNAYGDVNQKSAYDLSNFISSKAPVILNENLDFDHLKGRNSRFGNDNTRKFRQREMKKFYNESWGGENFDHREIQKHMSRDRSLWAIDAKDRMPSLVHRRPKCNYCNRVGHRDDTCRQKPPICHMCGVFGHSEPRCPNKICLNCGAPNFMYSTMCQRCRGWGGQRCAECGALGHPATHCPDLWRRYHNTTKIDEPLECTQLKKPNQRFCSGCSRRGHFIDSCRATIPFSALPIHPPYVHRYRPIYGPIEQRARSKSFSQDCPQQAPRNKRVSKSPTTHETHVNKKRNLSLDDPPKTPTQGQKVQKEVENSSKKPDNGDSVTIEVKTPNRNLPVDERLIQENSPAAIRQKTQREVDSGKKKTVNVDSSSTMVENTPPRNFPLDEQSISGTSIQKTLRVEDECSKNKMNYYIDTTATVTAGTPNSVAVSSVGPNRDNEGHLIQDNEVSDTSDAVTSARIYVTNEIISKLKTKDGEDWLKSNMEGLHVIVTHSDVNSFLNIKGKLANQEAFQSELRDWASKKNISQDVEGEEESTETKNVPKNRLNLLRLLDKSLDSLKDDMGDPKALYKELTFSQNKHEKLMKQKVISPTALSNSRTHINDMLKKLNIILLGQAGLADGSEHVNELHSYRHRLVNSRTKKISASLRKKIADHYHRVFTSSARDDYSDLVNQYYLPNSTPKTKKKRKNKQIKHNNSNLQEQNTPTKEIIKSVVNMQYKDNNKNNGEFIKRPPGNGQLQKLVFYYQRLDRAKLKPNQSKQDRKQIMRRIHTCMVSLHRREKMTSKAAKKMSRAQADAHRFLFL